MKVASLSQRRFDATRMQKLNLFETERFFLDVYCLEPGQSQKQHAHPGNDKVYAVLEGTVVAQVGGEERELKPGEAVLVPAGDEHGVVNRGSARAALLVFMAPRPG
ncbi:MAG TPA: cupin domain-containing protein [Myxococcales bacterium]|jgi:quercetin dioxygenase-like cupin family protein|nr:cupin domain-containing protein [Myxococcales bacterium]